ncbi:hypothetical protein C0Q70_10405 [Pomacea canaliculata]|uniref:Tetraspanin n=1 Tax=Pomacea canaliculata TaxID=400727 RepID=A0A2T7PCI9_POMCA|nr:hypothetical protein C0Q70_10405 [Pomacea canaliculata]
MRTRRTVRRASLLSLWFCIVTLPWQPCKGSNASSGQRLGFDGCTWVTDSGGTIDLSSLGLTNGKPRFLDVPGPDNFYYSYNPCYPFDEGNACVDAAVCQTDMSLYYQAGDASSPSLTEESGRPAILYQASREILRKTWVALICDTTASQPSLKALGDLGYGEYSGELTDGLPDDRVVYNRIRHQASGVALLPNVDFWRALPGLVKVHGGNDDVRDWSRDPDGADILADSIASVKSGLEEAAKRAGITLVTSSFSVASIAFCFSVALIIFGIFLAVVSVLGFIGVSCGFKSALVVFDDAVKPHLKQTITENYSGMNSSDSTTQIWNGVMIKDDSEMLSHDVVVAECCGVDNYNDFYSSSKWPRKLGNTSNFTTPLACCKTINTDYTCAVTPTPATSNYLTGCYSKFWDFIQSGIAIGIVVGILAFQANQVHSHDYFSYYRR